MWFLVNDGGLADLWTPEEGDSTQIYKLYSWKPVFCGSAPLQYFLLGSGFISIGGPDRDPVTSEQGDSTQRTISIRIYGQQSCGSWSSWFFEFGSGTETGSRICKREVKYIYIIIYTPKYTKTLLISLFSIGKVTKVWIEIKRLAKLCGKKTLISFNLPSKN